MTHHTPHNIWVVIPAAGIGRRMQADVPKQYLPLEGRTVLEQTVHRIAEVDRLSGIVIAVAKDDPFFSKQRFEVPQQVMHTIGGEERCHTVMNALLLLQSQGAEENDWVLVHDAARPCVRREDVETLITAVTSSHHCGGILAMPVRDTMKLANDDNSIDKTVDRQGLWHALTPQMFRLGELQAALAKAIDGKRLVTDEASAMELAGYHPLLVEGKTDNIKITHPQDLELAAFYLRSQAVYEDEDLDDGG